MDTLWIRCRYNAGNKQSDTTSRNDVNTTMIQYDRNWLVLIGL